MEEIETYMMTERACIIRTSNLLPTLQFMQECWRRLWELLPDDEWEFEFNILTFYKLKSWKKL